MSEEVLERHWRGLKTLPNVLNVGISTKWKDGKDTGVPSITIYVVQKVHESQLTPEHVVPKDIEGVPTDVVELRSDTWTPGETEISKLSPAEQRKRLGLTTRPVFPKVVMIRKYKAPSGEAEQTRWASPVQNQANCGSCTAFGNTGVGEACIRIAENNMNDPVKLSEAILFFCSGGSCNGGNTVEATLNWWMDNGVCDEACLPYQDHDQTCRVGICADWQKRLYELSSWNHIVDQNEQKSLLDTKPLNCTMAVHQSFFNYTGGKYQNLGPQDPIVGYHDIGCFGYSDKMGAHLIRNSWGIVWGQNCVVNGIVRPGYCWITYGELDPEMQELIMAPPPSPPPPPVTYTVTTDAGPNGAITPNGVIPVNTGGWLNFSITPNSGYQIADIKVDGVSLSNVAPTYFIYTFNKVSANHTISATFMVIPTPPPAPPGKCCSNGIAALILWLNTGLALPGQGGNMWDWIHGIIMLAAFGMLSAGWWVGKVDTTIYVGVCVAAVGGTLWSATTAKTKARAAELEKLKAQGGK
jgi:hypothetical protein